MSTETNAQTMHRSINWSGAFWVASGVPALVLFSIGGVAGYAGNLAFLIWIISMSMGFIQSFTYAEIAGLFPNKSGGASVYGAVAWVRYGKILAPLSVWCSWLGWTPVLSLGCSIAALYMLNAVAPIPAADSSMVAAWISANGASIAGDEAAKAAAAVAALTPSFRSWSLFSASLGPVSLSLNVAFFIGAFLMLMVFFIQHRGILSSATFQTWIGLLVIVPMVIVGIVPIINGSIDYSNFTDLVPLALPASTDAGSWGSIGSWTLILGGLFVAAWSTYAFETAVSYTSEFKDPAKDTFKAIFYSGLLCLAMFIIVPFSFQGYLGLKGMLNPSVSDGSGIADIMANMVGGGALVHGVLVMLMILALLLSIMTAMAGSSRTLYQGSRDGWLPRYLNKVNQHGAPTRAMWTDFIANLGILAVASADATSFFFILAVSNCGYMVFNFLNLNAGWIHRLDSPNVPRPYKASSFLLGLAVILSFVNAALMGAGAKVWNPVALWAGLIAIALVVPVFWFRHYLQDKGKFPEDYERDLHTENNVKRAGMLPYLTLVGGVVVMLMANWLFELPQAAPAPEPAASIQTPAAAAASFTPHLTAKPS